MELTLKNVRLSFNNFFEASAYKEGQKKSYGGKFLIEKGSATDNEIWKAIKTEAANTFGKKADATIERHKSNNMKFSYMDGDLSDRDEEQGFMVLNSKRREVDGRPTVLDRDKSPLQASDGKPYSGCYVNAIVSIYCQKGEFEGIRSGLLGVQFAKDGDAFSSAHVAGADAFEDMSDGADSESDLD